MLSIHPKSAKTLLCALFLSMAFSCTDQREVGPSQSLPDDAVNPTTEFEIYDSLANSNGTLLATMQIDRTIYTYNGDNAPVSQQLQSIYQYEYDEKQRLIRCLLKTNLHPQTRVTQLEYDPDGRIGKVKMNWSSYYNGLGKDLVWVVEKENAVWKIIPGVEHAPFFAPINPENDDYKNLIKLDAANQITQMSGTVNGFMSNHYSSLIYGHDKNIEKIIFSSVNRDGKLVHDSSLSKLEYTKYVRSPFKSHAFALAHHLTQNLGMSPSSDLFDFGANMPVKTYVYDVISEASASSRFGYQFAKGANVLHYDFVYRYNAKKLPVSAVKTYTYPGRPVEYVDSIRFQYK
jgi:YD repeat-containing protein